MRAKILVKPRGRSLGADQSNGHEKHLQQPHGGGPAHSVSTAGAASAPAAPALHFELTLAARQRLRPGATQTEKIRIVQSEVCKFYRIKRKEMLSETRFVRVCWPRQVAMTLCYEFGLGAMDAIASAFRRRDHGSVIYAAKAVQDFMGFPAIATEIEELRAALKRKLRVK